MATVLVTFDGDDVPIVTGGIPLDNDTPIANPVATGFMTNQAFIVAEGDYCLGLQSPSRYQPLWQVVQAVDGQQTEVAFRRVGL